MIQEGSDFDIKRKVSALSSFQKVDVQIKSGGKAKRQSGLNGCEDG
jgi:hypothetical protein